jgi:hypothetical protein
MKNHFHFLVRIKDENEIGFLKPYNIDKDPIEEKWSTISPTEITKYDITKLKKPVPYRMFGHMFNAYAKHYNFVYNHTGSLFEKTFHRKKASSTRYLQNLILYIHQNPIHHGIVNDILEYPWTSYTTIVSHEPTFLKREFVIECFGTIENFKALHKMINRNDLTSDFLIE